MQQTGSDFAERCAFEEVLYDMSFVGVHFLDGRFEIKYPLGYRLSSKEDEKQCRKDILNLIRVLRQYRSQDKVNRESKETFYLDTNFPLFAYMAVYNWYLKNGYYLPREVIFKKGTNGKINWSRTIKTTKPAINNNNAVYLDTVVRKQNYNDEELIAIINRFCVYKSYEKIGCLFSRKRPKKEKIRAKNKLFINVLNKKIESTFNDEERELFVNMRKILVEESNENSNKEFYFGTTNFNLIWEKMLDDVYGNNSVNHCSESHPHIYWNSNEFTKPKNLTLRPDTIMIHPNREDKIYVLDAKYYKAGVNIDDGNLPGGESILKQIVYAQKLERNDKIKLTQHKIYNAFLLPYGMKEKENFLVPLGSTSEDWYSEKEMSENDFLKIKAIRVDTKTLMYNHKCADDKMFDEMADLIERM